MTGEYHTDNPEENDIVSGYQHVGRIEIFISPVYPPASRAWRTATGRRRTRYPAYPHPDVRWVPPHFGHTSGMRPWQRRSRRSHHSSKPESGVPTRADGKYTSHGCPPASADRSFQSSPERTSVCRSLSASIAGFAISSILTNHCGLTIGSTVVPAAVVGTYIVGMRNDFDQKSHAPSDPLPWLFSPRSGPCPAYLPPVR